MKKFLGDIIEMLAFSAFAEIEGPQAFERERQKDDTVFASAHRGAVLTTR